jgi:ornithine cyclodeaminase/alanine dehydrogenase-like protein (mu-crystallin family)
MCSETSTIWLVALLVLGDLYDLVGGTVAGRRSADDITFFKNAGGGHLDLMTSEVVFQETNTNPRSA